MAPPGGPESKLRSIAVTSLVVAVALYVAAHLIASIAPELLVTGAVVAVGYTTWLIIRWRRW